MIVFKLTKPTEFTDRGFQTASAWRKILVPAGTYVGEKSTRSNNSWSFRLDGTCSADYFENRLFNHTSASIDQMKGQPCVYFLHIYGWQLDPIVGKGPQFASYDNTKPLYEGGSFERKKVDDFDCYGCGKAVTGADVEQAQAQGLNLIAAHLDPSCYECAEEFRYEEFKRANGFGYYRNR